MSRRTLLTPELEARICADIERGMFVSIAAEANGVSWSTLKEWIVRGEGTNGTRPKIGK